jgi:hypothetical protein
MKEKRRKEEKLTNLTFKTPLDSFNHDDSFEAI